MGQRSIAAQYPRNAWPIVQARANGMRPQGPVIVIMTDQYEALPDDANVYADSGQKYRWDWCKGLTVVVVVDSKTKLDSMLGEIEVGPGLNAAQLDVVDVEREQAWSVLSVKHGRLNAQPWPAGWARHWLKTTDQPGASFSSTL